MAHSLLSSKILMLTDINDWFQIDPSLTKFDHLALGQTVILDFERTEFLDPKGVIMLLTISQSIYNKTKKKLEIRNIRSDLLSYLERINLFKIKLFEIDLKTLIWDKYGRGIFSESVIEIRKIKSLVDKQILAEDVQEILSIWFPEGKYKHLRYNALLTLLELCGNSLEHSSLARDEIGECLFMLQKYTKRDYIEICMVVADFGIGIKDHLIRKYGNLYEYDYQYIEEALKGKSGRIDGSGGMGFKAIRQTAKNNNGILMVKSNKGIVSIDENVNIYEAEHSTIGTQCSIVLRKYKD
ncbi:hypothetical protein ACULLL_18855 [Lysinibacillus irui]|uniref:hypothetical protein n=1 Tax=Lysinibacillus irui TaxID=2998077 RepID=UPI0040439724